MYLLLVLFGAALACGPIGPEGALVTRAEISLELQPSVGWTYNPTDPGAGGQADDEPDARANVLDGLEVSLFRAMASIDPLLELKEISSSFPDLPLKAVYAEDCANPDPLAILVGDGGFVDLCGPVRPALAPGSIEIQFVTPITETMFGEIIDAMLTELAKRRAKSSGEVIKYFA
ncbi:unnamed protein product, partial [Mesorhabditis spiculigera]